MAAVATAALCTVVSATRPDVGVLAGAVLLVLLVIGRVTWTYKDVHEFDPWVLDAQAWVGYASFHLLSWVLAAVLVVGSVVARTRPGR